MQGCFDLACDATLLLIRRRLIAPEMPHLIGVGVRYWLFLLSGLVWFGGVGVVMNPRAVTGPR
jgi:hypothetical protein